jgi:LemA protein
MRWQSFGIATRRFDIDEPMPGNATTFITLGLVLVAALLGLRIYNRLVRAQVRTREAWSGIDVQLKRRANLIPNLVETVKGYAAHERGVFEAVTRARRSLFQAGGTAATAKANGTLTQALGRLLAVAEGYPDLKASANFLELQAELSDVEEKIAYARQFYNRNVAVFNARIKSVPDVLIARLYGFQPFDFFEAEEEAQPALRVELTR